MLAGRGEFPSIGRFTVPIDHPTKVETRFKISVMSGRPVEVRVLALVLKTSTLSLDVRLHAVTLKIRFGL